ncbi:acyl-CoA N-acyltransferase [Desarmillaria tabescens]|uniref:histone acetyltransferase n=1 Tax=Armillaria tabescens TaxID=1929756 RepID=A0AA39MGG9_ARMTA|nr:acyl-CoA N-acyltransferase [Desarmillaria tabescens]KAK0433936.1 acyl-CoA N-acyltransferase [Desarmillaria tabescens]
MPHVVEQEHLPLFDVIQENGDKRRGHVLSVNDEKVYVHYVGADKRLDEWLPGDRVTRVSDPSTENQTKKRKRSNDDDDGSSRSDEQTSNSPVKLTVTEEELDSQIRERMTEQRNFEKVVFGDYVIRTWYFSPYVTNEKPDPPGDQESQQDPPIDHARTHIVRRSTLPTQGRAVDFARGTARATGLEKSVLYVCDMCFKYTTDGMTWELHKKHCTMSFPPGRKVYQRGAHTIWEVDGAVAKLYCQNLSLFGKLFIDTKTIFFDNESFMFYILTEGTSGADHVIGYFSKEKISFDDYNLACIITFPPWQRKGFGMLMIEFSYELSRRDGKIGSPERPLSDLGLRSYLAYWVATLVRFFRRLLTVMPIGSTQIITKGHPPDLRSPSTEASEDGIGVKRKKKHIGWDGELHANGMLNSVDDELFSSLRTFVTKLLPSGGATTDITLECTLQDIAQATNLRVDDTAFAMNEVGLLVRRLRLEEGEKEGPKDMIVLTREMVEKVAEERNVKQPCLDPQYLCR